MNILIVSQYFYPENFRINDFAEGFVEKGHKVSVLTGTPNYPKGKFYKGYGIFRKNREIYKNIIIYRSPIIPRGSSSSLGLVFNYISFVIGGIFRALFLLKNEYDLIFVFQGSPVTMALPAIFIKKIKKIPICIWVVDLWPESVVSGSNLTSDLIPNLLLPIVKYIYKSCDLIWVSSKGFINSITQKGIDPTKVSFFPQWAEPVFRPLKYKKYLLGTIPEESFKVMFAGNIGEAQDFPSILEAAKLLREYSNIHWVILGRGRKENWVREKIDEFNLENNFHLLGGYPLEKMPEYYSHADCMLFSLKREYIFSITIPAKVQSYMACKKPIVAMIDGEAKNVIDSTSSGLSCASENPKLLAENILTLSKMSKSDLNEISINSLNAYREYFDRDMLLKKAEGAFKKLMNQKIMIDGLKS